MPIRRSIRSNRNSIAQWNKEEGFARPVCYQDFPQAMLPAELIYGNPLGIWRLLDGEFTRTALGDPSP